MFRKIRKKEKELTAEEAGAVLTSAAEGVLATVGEDGYPYAVPLNYVYHKGAVYFHCAPTGHKLANIAHSARVSFCVMTDMEVVAHAFTTRFKSVVLFGRAVEVTGDEKEEGLLALVDKYAREHVREGKKYIDRSSGKTTVIKIVIDHMTGKGKT